MSVQVPCPKCDFVIDSSETGSPPTHCPECGSRISCPECGSRLEQSTPPGQPPHCPTCSAQLSAGETQPFTLAERSSAAQPKFPGYEVLGEIGHGGMGIVYAALQRRLRRKVALKALPPALAVNPFALERFREEAAIAAQLTDAHVLPVFDIEEHDGVPILVLPLIEGADLGRILRDRRAVKNGSPPSKASKPHPWARLDDRAYFEQVLPLLDQVVAAVAVIHAAHVIHRDIKPSNVLVDERGHLWLSDFGLALLETTGGGSLPGMVGSTRDLIGGTRGYMSPEQERGARDLDCRADIYSLGVTLYQALTLEMPCGTPGQASFVPPSRRQPALSGDIDAVVAKALAPERDARYQTGAELRDDWQRARQGLPPHALRLGRWQRLGRRARRHARALAAALTIAALSVALFFALRKSDPRHLETVHVHTEPAGARVVLVPLDPDSGEPRPELALRPQGTTPLVVPRVPAGDYLVVADAGKHGFHEVYRRVPAPDQAKREHLHSNWDRDDAGELLWPKIVIPSSTVTRGMVKLDGGTFQMGMKELAMTPVHDRRVEAFYLDTHEVRIDAYKAVKKDLPAQLEKDKLPGDFPVVWVTFDAALDYAERIGKRLPDEAEYEFAATNGGNDNFPWGKEPKFAGGWHFGKVKEPSFDCTPAEVFGLYSNVAEWTTSWPAPYPGSRPEVVADNNSPDRRQLIRSARVVRGGDDLVAKRQTNVANQDPIFLSPRFRHGISRDLAHAGLGFRCARSAAPRWLQP